MHLGKGRRGGGGGLRQGRLILQVAGHCLLWGTGEVGLRWLASEQPPEGAVQEETVPAA